MWEGWAELGERAAGWGRRRERAGPFQFDGLKREKGELGRVLGLGWDAGFCYGFSFSISYFKHYSNLIEFKFKFEFNPST